MTASRRYEPVEVSRRIDAPASRIFEVLADPANHAELDGSGMLRGAVDAEVISGVGDTFAMRMYFEPIGDYLMLNHVVEHVPDRCLAWAPSPGDAKTTDDGAFPIGVPAGHRWTFRLDPDGQEATLVTEIFDCRAAPEPLQEAVQGGAQWIDAMTATLVKLDERCRQPARS